MSDDEPMQFARVLEVVDREAVKEHAEDKSEIIGVAECGPGLMLEYRPAENRHRAYTTMLENHGWYVAAFKPSESGDKVVAMPLPEVDES